MDEHVIGIVREGGPAGTKTPGVNPSGEYPSGEGPSGEYTSGANQSWENTTCQNTSGDDPSAEAQPGDNLLCDLPKNMTVEVLATRSVRGDREALKALCTAISGGVMFRVARKMKNRMDAEDTAQEILIKVCENIGGLKNPKAFGGWLNTIINNEISRHYTKNSKRSAVVWIGDYINELTDDNEEYHPDEYAIREEDRKVVMSIVDRLPERQLEAVLLHYYEGMSVTKAAAAMGVAQQAVTRYLNLARGKIRIEIDKYSSKAGAMDRISFMPASILLSQVLRQEAAHTAPLGEASIMQALEGIGPQAGAIAGGVAAGGKLLGKVITDGARQIKKVGDAAKNITQGKNSTGIAMSAVVAAAVTIIIALSIFTDAPPASVGAVQQAEAEVVFMEGEIVFTGGDPARSSENPTNASVWARNEGGELQPRYWNITAPGSEVELYSGDNDEVGDVLRRMMETGQDGKYNINFFMDDSLGGEYMLVRVFTIDTAD